MIRGLLPIFFFSIIMTFSIDSFATKYVALQDGNWGSDSDAVWGLGKMPTAADTVYINGKNITVDDKFTVKAIFITNLSDVGYTRLNIIDTLTITGNLIVTAENKARHIDVTVNGSGVLTVEGNMNFTRTADNVKEHRLLFKMAGTSKTYIRGELNYDYKNSSISEISSDIYTAGSAILDVTGQTTLITRAGKDLDFVLEGTSQVILRDSLSLLLYGGQETAITADVNSHFQLLANAYLLNQGGSNHTKLKSGAAGGKMTITGNVYMDSKVADKMVTIEAFGSNAELNISGDIVMTATADESVLIFIKNSGKLNLGGDILRPTNFGALKMLTQAKLTFNGTEAQTMPVGNILSSGVDSLYFGIVSMENTSSTPFELSSNLIIKDSLILTTGKIKTTTSSLLIIEDGAFIKGGDSDSYVDGPIMKRGAVTAVPFTFPIGDELNYAPLTITPETTKTTAEYTARYSSDPPPFGVILLNSRSDSEYWEVNKSEGTPDADITLSWYDAEAQGINNLNDLVVAGLTPNETPGEDPEWKSYGNGGTTGTTGTDGSGTIINSLTSDPPPFGVIFFTYGSTTAMNSLPVELTSFQAVQQSSHAYLQWETASERNTSHFSIERSVNGVDFKEIGSAQGSGDGVIAHHYNFKDIAPESGINYYRLKIVDHDNTFEYSNIEVINFEAAPAIQLYPNPVEKTIQLEGFDADTDNVQLEIFDKSGRLIFSNKISIDDGRLHISTNLVNVQDPGTYFIRVISQGQSHVLKFIKF